MSISSENIFVFPCVSRSKNYDLKAKLMSEENITNIIKSITDKKSYIINDDLSNLEFVIDGYYFKLTGVELKENRYAYISTKKNGVTPNEFTLLIGDNNSNSFEGLIIDSAIPDGKDYLTLCEGGKIPADSKIKFSRESLNMSSIDCGELK